MKVQHRPETNYANIKIDAWAKMPEMFKKRMSKVRNTGNNGEAYISLIMTRKRMMMHLPSFVALKSSANTGTINNGDVLIIAPITSSKTYHGSGSMVTGDLPATFTLFSATITNDQDIIDDSNAKVATGT